MDVETEPIHFTQDDHHSIQERPTHDAPIGSRTPAATGEDDPRKEWKVLVTFSVTPVPIAKFQTDLITTTSRKRTQWGRPPPRRVFKQKHKTPKQRLSLHQSLNSFPHRKRREQSKFAVHAACTVLCWSSCTCPVLNTAAESHRFQTHQKYSASH